MNDEGSRTKTTVRSKTAATVKNGDNIRPTSKLTEKEIAVRKIKKYATTSSLGFNTRAAYTGGGMGGVSESSQGNFYSPQLSTDFLEKPQNLRERRAWYRHFYNANEFVGQAIDLHSTLPLSKIRLEKPHGSNQEQIDYVYEYFVEMCNENKLFKTLLEISHEYHLLGNCGAKWAEINVADGIKRIEDIRIGDIVLTDKGRYRKVVKTASRIAPDILRIKCWKDFREIPVTEEHPIEVLKDGEFHFVPASDININDFIRITWPTVVEDINSIKFKFPECYTVNENNVDLKIAVKHDRNAHAVIARKKLLSWIGSLKEPIILTRKCLCEVLGIRPRLFNCIVSNLDKEMDQVFHKRIGAKGYQKGSQVMWLPIDTSGIEVSDSYTIYRNKSLKSITEINIDEDFCYLLGFWLGDGTLGRDSNRNTWGRGLWQINFKNDEKDNIDRVRTVLYKVFGVDSISEWDSDGMTYLKVISNPAFIEWWAENFGETSRIRNKKRIPQWVTNLPVHKLKFMLSGLLDSDGCSHTNQKHNVVSLSMVSKYLMIGVRDVVLKCGGVVSFNRSKCKPNNSLKRLKNFEVRDVFVLSSSEEFTCKLFTENSNKKLKGGTYLLENSHAFKKIGDKIALKVKSITYEDYNDLVYNFEVEEDHTYQVAGFSTHNCFIYAEDHNPYEVADGDKAGEDKVAEMKEWGKQEAERLFKDFKVTDKDPNYKGWRKLIILPPDQVRIKKIPFSDESLIEFIPDPETRKSILSSQDPSYYPLSPEEEAAMPRLPNSLSRDLQKNGSIPLDTDPFSGSYVYHMARKKSQYETLGVSILERCINSLLLQDKLRQAQTQIASRHMTPIRVVWAEDLSDVDVENLREQVDLALVDPDFSIIANYEVHWEEMGSNGRLLELSGEYEHIENSLFAGLGVTREILTGEGTYAGNKMTLEILNTQYLLFRELLQEYVEDYLFKPVAKKKGFIEKDKYGREKLIYPKLSFTRLAIKDNDTFFDQAMQLYNKGSISIDVILEMLNIDPISTRKKIEADLFTVNDFAFNQLMSNVYNAAGQALVEKYTVAQRLANYMNLDELPPPPPGEEGMGGGLGGGLGGGMGRFSSNGMDNKRQAALTKLMSVVLKNPSKLDSIVEYLSKG
jgi:intein/homing endonuclease